MISRRTISRAAILGLLASQGSLPGRPVAQLSTPVPGNPAFGELFGQDVPELPMAQPGEVAVVSYGVSYDVEGVSIADCVIHNNGNETVAITELIGTARDTRGLPFAESSVSAAGQFILAPGEYGIAGVVFEENVPLGTAVAFEVLVAEPPYFMLDLRIRQLLIGPDRVVGVVENAHDLSDCIFAFLMGVFFEDDGSVCGSLNAILLDRVAAGSMVAFSRKYGLAGRRTNSFLVGVAGQTPFQ